MADFIISLLEFVYEDDVPLVVVGGKEVVDHRAFLPPLVRAPRAKEVRLIFEIGAVDTVEVQRQQTFEVLSQLRFAMAAWAREE